MIKVLLVLLGVSWCYAQINVPVVTKRIGAAGIAAGPVVLPSAGVRNFVSYPNVVRRGSVEDALAIAGPLLRSKPVLGPGFAGYAGYAAGPAVVAPAIAPAVLDKVATYGLTNGVTGGIALGAKTGVLGPVLAAIITTRTADVVDVPTPPDVIHPQVLIVEPNLLPVTIEFRSQSSPVNINQVHIPGPPGEVKETRSEEEPDRVLHEVVKPVIQEVREIIQPFRKITQEILPVQEEVHSLVARGDNKKVLEEVPIPAPAPIALAAPAPVVVKAPAVAIEPPVITALGQKTIVRAGLVGGARVLEAPELIPAATLSRRSGRKLPVADVSFNNRGPVRPIRA